MPSVDSFLTTAGKAVPHARLRLTAGGGGVIARGRSFKGRAVAWLQEVFAGGAAENKKTIGAFIDAVHDRYGHLASATVYEQLHDRLKEGKPLCKRHVEQAIGMAEAAQTQELAAQKEAMAQQFADLGDKGRSTVARDMILDLVKKGALSDASAGALLSEDRPHRAQLEAAIKKAVLEAEVSHDDPLHPPSLALAVLATKRMVDEAARTIENKPSTTALAGTVAEDMIQHLVKDGNFSDKGAAALLSPNSPDRQGLEQDIKQAAMDAAYQPPTPGMVEAFPPPRMAEALVAIMEDAGIPKARAAALLRPDSPDPEEREAIIKQAALDAAAKSRFPQLERDQVIKATRKAVALRAADVMLRPGCGGRLTTHVVDIAGEILDDVGIAREVATERSGKDISEEMLDDVGIAPEVATEHSGKDLLGKLTDYEREFATNLLADVLITELGGDVAPNVAPLTLPQSQTGSSSLGDRENKLKSLVDSYLVRPMAEKVVEELTAGGDAEPAEVLARLRLPRNLDNDEDGSKPSGMRLLTAIASKLHGADDPSTDGAREAFDAALLNACRERFDQEPQAAPKILSLMIDAGLDSPDRLHKLPLDQQRDVLGLCADLGAKSVDVVRKAGHEAAAAYTRVVESLAHIVTDRIGKIQSLEECDEATAIDHLRDPNGQHYDPDLIADMDQVLAKGDEKLAPRDWLKTNEKLATMHEQVERKAAAERTRAVAALADLVTLEIRQIQGRGDGCNEAEAIDLLKEEKPELIEQMDRFLAGGDENPAPGAWLETRKQLATMRQQVEGLAKSDEVRGTDMQALISAQLREIAINVFDSAVKTLGEPPVPFTVLSLGSTARGEASPYSDLEFGILLHETASPNQRLYFSELTERVRDQIAAAGEHDSRYIPEGFHFDEQLSPLYKSEGKTPFMGTADELVDAFREDGGDWAKTALLNAEWLYGSDVSRDVHAGSTMPDENAPLPTQGQEHGDVHGGWTMPDESWRALQKFHAAVVDRLNQQDPSGAISGLELANWTFSMAEEFGDAGLQRLDEDVVDVKKLARLPTLLVQGLAVQHGLLIPPATRMAPNDIDRYLAPLVEQGGITPEDRDAILELAVRRGLQLDPTIADQKIDQHLATLLQNKQISAHDEVAIKRLLTARRELPLDPKIAANSITPRLTLLVESGRISRKDANAILDLQEGLSKLRVRSHVENGKQVDEVALTPDAAQRDGLLHDPGLVKLVKDAQALSKRANTLGQNPPRVTLSKRQTGSFSPSFVQDYRDRLDKELGRIAPPGSGLSRGFEQELRRRSEFQLGNSSEPFPPPEEPENRMNRIDTFFEDSLAGKQAVTHLTNQLVSNVLKDILAGTPHGPFQANVMEIHPGDEDTADQPSHFVINRAQDGGYRVAFTTCIQPTMVEAEEIGPEEMEPQALDSTRSWLQVKGELEISRESIEQFAAFAAGASVDGFEEEPGPRPRVNVTRLTYDYQFHPMSDEDL
jgi:Putative nucleotidyltransferase DUF294